MFDWLKDFFRSIFDAIKKVLAIALLIIAAILIIWSVLATGGATLVIFGYAISTTMAMFLGGLAIVGAFLIDAETAGEVVGKVGEAVGDAVEAVTGAGASIVGGAIKGLFSSPLGIAIAAIGGLVLYNMLTDDDSGQKSTVVYDSKPKGKYDYGSNGNTLYA